MFSLASSAVQCADRGGEERRGLQNHDRLDISQGNDLLTLDCTSGQLTEKESMVFPVLILHLSSQNCLFLPIKL